MKLIPEEHPLKRAETRWFLALVFHWMTISLNNALNLACIPDDWIFIEKQKSVMPFQEPSSRTLESVRKTFNSTIHFLIRTTSTRDTYLKKNKEPSGRTTRRSDGTNGVPLWYHCISGGGRPAALQFSVSGSSRAATASAGCSIIRGRCCAAKAKRNWKVYINKS